MIITSHNGVVRDLSKIMYIVLQRAQHFNGYVFLYVFQNFLIFSKAQFKNYFIVQI